MPFSTRKFDLSKLGYLGLVGFLGAVFDLPYLHWLVPFSLFSLIAVFRNPYVFGQSVLQTAGNIFIAASHPMGLPNRDNYTNKAAYRLPFRSGTWKVVNGGSTKENSHSWGIFTQRYAYDLLIVDDAGVSHSNEGSSLRDYHCFGMEVVSPSSGQVVSMRDGIRDYTGVGDRSKDPKTRDFRGNHVVIKHSDGEYTFLAHFKENSLRVTVGEQLEQGQVIGLCGNSGHSTEPHIHIHLQSRKSFWFGAGLPMRFTTFEKKCGERFQEIDEDFIEKGDQIRNSNCHDQ